MWFVKSTRTFSYSYIGPFLTISMNCLIWISISFSSESKRRPNPKSRKYRNANRLCSCQESPSLKKIPIYFVDVRQKFELKLYKCYRITLFLPWNGLKSGWRRRVRRISGLPSKSRWYSVCFILLRSLTTITGKQFKWNPITFDL